ncbi:MAG: hypothetical protein CL917_01295 [Deltaproteobacteria bacterium]|nr:hypothetical protein [Deltaproteobacteria bacterium]
MGVLEARGFVWFRIFQRVDSSDLRANQEPLRGGRQLIAAPISPPGLIPCASLRKGALLPQGV